MRIPPIQFDAPKALLWIAIIASLAVLVVPDLFNSASQFDTGHWFKGVDTYMRVLRVREWIDVGQWYDSFSHRSNWPFGEKLHWTRPMDVAIVALAVPFLPFLDLPNALYAGALIVSPTFYLLAVLALMWGAKGFLDARGRIIFVVLFALQPTLHFYFVFARPDHHSLILFVFALVLALLARHAHAAPNTNVRLPGWAGVASAFGIWVSIEMLSVELFALIALAMPWLIWGDAKRLLPLERFSRWGALALAAFLMIERPPGEWLSSEVYDRLSTVHVFVLALIAIGIVAIRKAQHRFGDTIFKRLTLGSSAALGAGAILLWVYPDFYKGPFGAAMAPGLKQIWLDNVVEFQTLAEPTSDALVSAIFLLAPLLWLGLWAVWTYKDKTPNAPQHKTLPLVLVFVIAALVFTPLTIAQSRWAAYMGVLYTVPWAVVLTRILDWRGDWRGGPVKGGTPLLRAPLFVTVMMGHAIIGAGLSGALEDQPPKVEACRWGEIAPFLNSPKFADGAPQTIFNFTHNGPEIIYRTHHRVVATPYHRNTQGILDSYTAFGGVDMAKSEAILHRRGVNFLITCVDSVDERIMLKEKGDTLIRRLVEGREPSWLHKYPLPDGLDAYFRVYAFVPTTP